MTSRTTPRPTTTELPLVGVLSHKMIAGKDKPEDQAPALQVMPFKEAFEREHFTDAHMVCYHPTEHGQPAKRWPRLNKGILTHLEEAGGQVMVHTLMLDWDCKGHVPWTPELEKEFEAKLGAARDAGLDLVDNWTLFYRTLCGCRFVFVLTNPVEAKDAEDLLRGMFAAFAQHDLEIDNLFAWNTLFRLPKVRRKEVGNTWENPFFRIHAQYENRLDPDTIAPIKAPEKVSTNTSSINDLTLPGSDYNVRGLDHMRETLRRHGWTLVGESDGNERWRRPGKTKDHSATFDGTHFYCFSTNAAPFTNGTAYRPFKVYSLLAHDGQDSDAARCLGDLGYGEVPEEMGVDLSQFNMKPNGWREPEPLTADIGEPTTFPIEALPDWLAAMVGGVAYSTQTPPELAGSVGLATLSLAGAGKWVVNPWGGWHEELCLWFLVSLPPGCRKSSVFNQMAQPVMQWEDDQRKLLEPEINAIKSKHRILTKKLEFLEKKASQDKDTEHNVFEAAILTQELSDLKIPIFPRLICNDATPEAVTRLLAQQGGRIGLLSAEGGELTAIAGGRYSKDGKSNLEVFLKGHAGDAIRVDRASPDREPIILNRPNLVMALCVQPSVLLEAWEHDQFNNRGMLARFFFAIPRSPLGTRLVRTPAVPDEVITAYKDNLKRMIDLTPAEGEKDKPPELVFSSEAATILETYAKQLEPELGIGGSAEHMTGWAGKLVGGIARLAGIIHLATTPVDENPTAKPIETGTIEAALTLGDYYRAEATRVHGAYGSDPRVLRAMQIIQWIKRIKKNPFTERDAQRGTRLKKEETKIPMELLEQTGHIRPVANKSPRSKGQPGRNKSDLWEANPTLLGNSFNSVNIVTGVGA